MNTYPQVTSRVIHKNDDEEEFVGLSSSSSGWGKSVGGGGGGLKFFDVFGSYSSNDDAVANSSPPSTISTVKVVSSDAFPDFGGCGNDDMIMMAKEDILNATGNANSESYRGNGIEARAIVDNFFDTINSTLPHNNEDQLHQEEDKNYGPHYEKDVLITDPLLSSSSIAAEKQAAMIKEYQRSVSSNQCNNHHQKTKQQVNSVVVNNNDYLKLKRLKKVDGKRQEREKRKKEALKLIKKIVPGMDGITEMKFDRPCALEMTAKYITFLKDRIGSSVSNQLDREFREIYNESSSSLYCPPPPPPQISYHNNNSVVISSNNTASKKANIYLEQAGTTSTITPSPTGYESRSVLISGNKNYYNQNAYKYGVNAYNNNSSHLSGESTTYSYGSPLNSIPPHKMYSSPRS